MAENDLESRELFVRANTSGSGDSDETNDWDDTALIKAYDKAVNLAKEEVAKRMDQESQGLHSKKSVSTINKKKTPQKQKWKVGDSCRAKYSGDGEIYEAVITNVARESDECTVKYIGYGNTETVQISHLLSSAGVESLNAQIEAAKPKTRNRQCNGNAPEQMDFENTNYSFNLPNTYSFDLPTGDMPPAPPLPPQLIARLPENNADALSSMLMSWYISGFHTGYYHGLKHARDKQEKQKN